MGYANRSRYKWPRARLKVPIELNVKLRTEISEIHDIKIWWNKKSVIKIYISKNFVIKFFTVSNSDGYKAFFVNINVHPHKHKHISIICCYVDNVNSLKQHKRSSNTGYS